MSHEFLFAYGTLQLDAVQLATFGRHLTGSTDSLSGFALAPLAIEDPHVIAVSGKSQHTIAQFTGRPTDTICGIVYEVTPEELEHADEYEVSPCRRVSVVLQSGTRAWLYIDGRFPVPAIG